MKMHRMRHSQHQRIYVFWFNNGRVKQGSLTEDDIQGTVVSTRSVDNLYPNIGKVFFCLYYDLIVLNGCLTSAWIIFSRFMRTGRFGRKDNAYYLERISYGLVVVFL